MYVSVSPVNTKGKKEITLMQTPLSINPAETVKSWMRDTSQENKGILGEIRGWENINLSRVIIQISICACLFLYIKKSQIFYIVILSVCDTLVEGLEYRYLYILWLLNSSYNMITKKKLCHQSGV